MQLIEWMLMIDGRALVVEELDVETDGDAVAADHTDDEESM